jgi:hypothetical protein
MIAHAALASVPPVSIGGGSRASITATSSPTAAASAPTSGGSPATIRAAHLSGVVTVRARQ